jgi:hypothetical protein
MWTNLGQRDKPRAAASRDKTNIHLLTFVEFQRTFFDEWRSGIFMQLERMCDVIVPLTLYGVNLQHLHYVSNVSEIALKLHGVNIFQKYEVFLGEARQYSRFFIERGEFPIVITDPRRRSTCNAKRSGTITARIFQYCETRIQRCVPTLFTAGKS